MERHNRKSHLAPQLSPATKALLRDSASSSSPSHDASASSKTPTSGEIPIAGEDMKSSPASDIPAIKRGLSADVNGGIYPTQAPVYDRPIFPPRTSSTSVLSTTTRPGTGDAFNLPIRPAPPPSGPLPPPPTGSLRGSTSRRQPIDRNLFTQQ